MTDKKTQARPVSSKQMRALIVRLTTGSEKRGIRAAEALGQIGDPRAVSALILAINEKNTGGMVRFSASYALGKIRNPQAVSALMDALSDKEIDGFTRCKIVEALAAIGDPQAAPALIRSFPDSSPEACIRAATVLGAWESKAAIPALIAALKDQASETKYDIGENGARYNYVTCYVCDEAATALGRIGDARAVPALSELWQDKHAYGHTHARALQALGDIGGLLAIDALLQALGSTDHRKDAVKALATIGLPASPALLDALRRETQPFLIPTLIEILSSDEYLLPRCRAAQMLKAIAAQYPEPSLRAALWPLHQQRKRDPVFQDALTAIDAATAAFKDLPLPAAAPLPDARTLPRPAAAADVPACDPMPPAPGVWRRLSRGIRGILR